MKKVFIAVLVLALTVAAVITFSLSTLAADLPFTNLFQTGFEGYTSDEGQILTPDYVSSQKITVSAGESVWFGPCEPAQYFQLVGFDADGNAVTGKMRGKELELADRFANGTVLYRYTVPSGLASIVISVPAAVAEVYTVSKTELSELNWRAFWSQQGVDVADYVGQSSYYSVTSGDRLYFGAITEAGALSSTLYDEQGASVGTMAAEDLRLVESFGGEFGIYCYTVPSGSGICYARISYDPDYEQYYSCTQVSGSETVTDESIVSGFIRQWGVPLPLESTVTCLSGKTALFLGDSITYGARDRANIYASGGWAGRIGYYAGMDVTNNGVSGACISTARVESSSEAHYIYNNLLKTKGTTYDYVIMHGLFNDASEDVKVGTMQGKAGFDPAKADVTTYAGALELLFHQARVQNPDAALGFIVNFHTERSVDQLPYVEMAIAICKDWGVPYLDLYNNKGFSVVFDDGLHPSSAGYDSMYTIVANWMATLAGGSGTSTGAARVMSYNVYYGENTPSGVEDISDRLTKAAELIRRENPDVVLLQEATDAFMSAARKTMSGYSYYGSCHKCGYGLNGVSAGNVDCFHEMAPIGWNSAKYTQLDSGCFRTGDFGISSAYPRCINWVVLKENATGNELLVMNYHADPNDEDVRNKTAELVLEQMDLILQAHGGIPALIGGDWNMSAGSAAYSAVTACGLQDIRAAVNPKAPGSFNDWTRTETSKFSMGDYIFVTGDVNASGYEVITDDLDTGRTDGKTVHISDHCPIVANISY